MYGVAIWDERLQVVEEHDLDSVEFFGVQVHSFVTLGMEGN